MVRDRQSHRCTFREKMKLGRINSVKERNMKVPSLRTAVLALAAITLSSIGSTSASAQSINIRIGTPPPPPPPNVYPAWGRPFPGAVWIPGHHEWVGGRWIWVGGYYSYPPRRGGYWVPARYRHGYYYPGHWAY